MVTIYIVPYAAGLYKTGTNQAKTSELEEGEGMECSNKALALMELMIAPPSAMAFSEEPVDYGGTKTKAIAPKISIRASLVVDPSSDVELMNRSITIGADDSSEERE